MIFIKDMLQEFQKHRLSLFSLPILVECSSNLLILKPTMESLRKLLILIWKCWFYLLTAILVILIGLFWVFPFSFFSKTFPLAYKGIRLWGILIFYGSGFSLEVERKKELKKNKSYIFIANHTSILDIMVMAILHKRHPIVFVGKEELAQIPIFGIIYRRICIVVNRKDMKSRSHVFQLAKRRISQGESIVIFPEGGIPDDRQTVLDRFKDGPFTIGISTAAPIVVYTIKGLKEMFPETFFGGYPGKVKVKLLDIIEVEGLTLENKRKIKDICYQMMLDDLNQQN